MNKISKMMLRVAALASLSVGFGLAQSSTTLNAAIPFDFTIGNTTLPAGEYTISSVVGSSCVHILDAQHRVQASVLANIVNHTRGSANDSKLVFRVHGNKYYLGSTWSASAGSGYEMRTTPAEREAEIATTNSTRTLLLAQK